MRSDDASYYDVIGVAVDASEHEIRSAYRQKALHCHPDKQHGELTSRQFLELQAAWETLRDPASRDRYDASIRDVKLKSRSPDGRPILCQVELAECIAISTCASCPDLLDAYLYECRCGEDYFIDPSVFKDGRQVVPCSSCSFCIEVIR